MVDQDSSSNRYYASRHKYARSVLLPSMMSMLSCVNVAEKRLCDLGRRNERTAKSCLNEAAQ